MKLLLNIFFIIFLANVSLAQGAMEGKIILSQDSQLDSLLNKYEILRMKLMDTPDNKAIPGYRIQIFFDSGANSSDRAKDVEKKFEEKYENIPAYITWKAPNYRLRVGDFRTRLEAEKYLQAIVKDYPNAWVIKDEINFPNLNQY